MVLLYASLLVWGQLAALSWILCLWVFGSCIIFFLTRVLGADVTLAHTLGSLGYNCVPLPASPPKPPPLSPTLRALAVLPLVISRVVLLAVGSSTAHRRWIPRGGKHMKLILFFRKLFIRAKYCRGTGKMGPSLAAVSSQCARRCRDSQAP